MTCRTFIVMEEWVTAKFKGGVVGEEGKKECETERQEFEVGVRGSLIWQHPRRVAQNGDPEVDDWGYGTWMSRRVSR